LSGTGTFTLSNNAQNFIFGTSGSNVLANQSTIQGSGNIGDGQMALNNSGTIDANQPTNLILQISNGATNTGTLEATNNATLVVQGGTYTNTGGTIQAGAGSTVQFVSGATINGGTITQTNGTIEFPSFSSSTIGAEILNPANSGQVKIDNGSAVTLGAGSSISNAGTITMNSTGNVTDLLIGTANVTLSGTGTFTMSNTVQNFIFGTAATNQLTNQSTIQGAGNIGDGQMALNNTGTIDANQSNALTLQISNGATNIGTIEATSGGTLILNGGTYTNTGGTISDNASTLELENSATINGGTVSQTGAGTLKLAGGIINTAVSNSTTGTVEVIGFTNNTIAGTSTNPAGGHVTIDNGGVLTMGTGSSISNAGTMTMNSSGNVTELLIGAANVTLSGTGTFTMSNSAENFIFGSVPTNQLTNQSTIQGAGNIGDGTMALNNSGTIDANQATPLILQISNGATNTGKLEATAGGTLTLNGGNYTNTGGTILASGANSKVLLQSGVTITGGTLTSTSGGVFMDENSATLSGLTISAGTIDVLNTTILTLQGPITNKGTINLQSTGNVTELNISGSITLTAPGKVIMSANANNFILGSGTLTNQGTISGEGNIGDGTIAVVNSGSILANETGTHTPSTLFIDTNGSGFTNNVGSKSGILNVSAKNTLIIEGGPLNNFSSGTLTAGQYLVAGELEFAAGTGIVNNNATISLTGATAEIFNTSNSMNALLPLASNGVAGSFALAGGAKFTTAGNFTNNGTLNVGVGDKFSTGTNGASNLTNYNSGTSTLTGGVYILAGTGQIQFNNGGNASDIVTNAANITLSSASTTNSFVDQSNNNALANFATNASNGSFTLSADRNFTTGGNLTNAGIVNVQKSTGTGSTALIIGGTGIYSQTGGTTTVDGRLTASGGINISGGFLYGNAAGSLSGNAGTLVGNLSLTGGTLNPGDGLKKIGDLNITGTYSESGAGILNIDLDGIVANSKYDVLNVSGAATLGGTITIDLITGFNPVVGNSWDVLNYASATGAFSTVNLPTAPVGDHYVFACGATNCTLTLDAGTAAPNSASKGTVSASPATRVSRNLGALASASNTHEPLAILSLATCSAARMLVSMSCGERAAAILSHGNELHAVASAGSGLGTVHNNVAHNNVIAASAGSGAGAVHNNVMVATRSMSSARGGASNEPSASASAMARLYVCAYMPSTLARTMGCSN
jgi:hypothetical protein